MRFRILRYVCYESYNAALVSTLLTQSSLLGGIFFGYDSGYISGVLGMDYVIHTYTGLPYSDSGNEDLWTLPSWQKSLIVSILSAGTFFGAIIAGDLAGEIASTNISPYEN